MYVKIFTIYDCFFQTQLSTVLHGETRSKELVSLFNKLGVGIPYKDIIALEDAWAVNEITKVNAKYVVYL